MRINKRLAAFALVGVTLATLTACGRADAGPAEGGGAEDISDGPATGSLTVWAMGAEGENLDKLTKTFEEQNPDVEVEVTAVPWGSAHDKFIAAIASGTTPDVAQVGTTWMGEFAGLNALDPVPAQIDDSVFFEGANATNLVDGVSYGVPWYVETRVVFYRTDIAEAAGITEPPTDWDGLHDMAAAMRTQPGVDWGISLQPGGTGSWQTLLPFMWQAGGDITNDALTEFTFDSPENADALSYYQSFFTDGLADSAPTEGTTEADFVDGRVPMFISGPWMIGSVEALGGEGFADEYGVAVMPSAEKEASFVGGSNLGVFSNTKNRDAAWKLVQFLTEEETQASWFDIVGDLPSVKGAWTTDALKSDEKLAVFGTQLETAKAPPSITTWEQIATSLDAQVEAVTKTGSDPAEALRAVQQEATSIGFGGE